MSVVFKKITDVSGVEPFFSVKKTVEIRNQKEAQSRSQNPPVFWSVPRHGVLELTKGHVGSGNEIEGSEQMNGGARMRWSLCKFVVRPVSFVLKNRTHDQDHRMLLGLMLVLQMKTSF